MRRVALFLVPISIGFFAMTVMPASARADTGAERIQAGKPGVTAGLHAPNGLAPHAQVSLGRTQNGASLGQGFVGVNRRGALLVAEASNHEASATVGANFAGQHGVFVRFVNTRTAASRSMSVSGSGLHLTGRNGGTLSIDRGGLHAATARGVARMSRLYIGSAGAYLKLKSEPGAVARGVSRQGVNLTRRAGNSNP